MNYLQRSKRNHHRLPYGRHLALLAGIFLVGWAFFSLAGGFVVSAVSPIWRSENFASRSFLRAGEYLRSRSALVAENAALKLRLSSLEAELAAANLELSRTGNLASLLGRERRAGEIIASVLTRPPQSPYDLFIIDAGADDGVALGSAVSLPSGSLVGKVAEVLPSSAKVRLFSAPGEKTDAALERGGIPVVLEGRGGGSFKIVVPREVVAVPGDRVLSAGSDAMLLAVVEGVETDATDSFEEILARSPANIFSVRLVSVSRQAHE